MKLISRYVVPFMLMFGLFLLSFPNEAYLQTDYEKWGRIAVEKTKERYPDSAVSDYDYEGHEKIADNVAADWFEFELKRGQKERMVKVRVKYSPETNKLISVDFYELQQQNQ
ncbi:uncharacterized protein DUF3889 [Scopulibacillus darangshiensis]|uniref:Uncharacterized protein DUF3889 n=1 Tax=Scopulibacillus darangshiensis TaxID=442528 RepID=A0A4R2P5P7_9BACL|nr:DUF3889 domain-containing protein [Scopulibacillus darangshiensis]TCP29291.1 uncharacterized protein DUF3889 [Scopulibacillus darangshiensis]